MLRYSSRPEWTGSSAFCPTHAPLLTALQPGEIRVVREGEESYMAVSGGFLEVMSNRVTILADTAERAEEIDIERAEEAMQRAQERIESSVSAMDLQRALASIRRSQARLLAARRRQPRRNMAAAAPTQQQQS